MRTRHHDFYSWPAKERRHAIDDDFCESAAETCETTLKTRIEQAMLAARNYNAAEARSNLAAAAAQIDEMLEVWNPKSSP